MNDQASLDAFLDKWRARWPEWRIAEAFVPARERAATLAWLALRQELADAAWGGADARPGAAKLAWWSDELAGWAQGRRRHPLGLALQRLPAPWAALAASLPLLGAARELPQASASGLASMRAALAPFVDAGDAVSRALPGDGAGAMPVAPRAGSGGGAFGAGIAALRVLAGEGASDAANALLEAWPAHPAGTRADRIFAALARARLRALTADGGAGARAMPPWRALWVAWRAGRSVSPA